jgi:hypothetical protein
MNFQQEKQLAGASPRTWLSSTDKMCTTDSLAGFNLHSISAPAVQFQLILVVLEFSYLQVLQKMSSHVTPGICNI